eukprot:5528255-Amphidinium_carterae.1
MFWPFLGSKAIFDSSWIPVLEHAMKLSVRLSIMHALDSSAHDVTIRHSSLQLKLRGTTEVAAFASIHGYIQLVVRREFL